MYLHITWLSVTYVYQCSRIAYVFYVFFRFKNTTFYDFF